jgi:mannosidase alpha-like ER degradation enhancer 2
MESFFLAETVKYLWLLFDLAAGPDNLVENGPYKYVFSTEGHLLPATPQISLVQEHCSYFGAYCRSNHSRQKSYTSNISMDSHESNSSRLCRGSVSTSFASDWSSKKSTHVSGFIKGVCPGLTHGQKFGISYVASPTHDNGPSNERETTIVQNHKVVVVGSPPPQYSEEVQNDRDTKDEQSSKGGSKESPTSKSGDALAVDQTFER